MAGESSSHGGRITWPVSSFLPMTRGRWPSGQVVEDVADLGFDERAFFLDHQDLVEAGGEIAQALGLERPGHGDLVERKAEFLGVADAEPDLVEGLAQIEIGFCRW